MNTETQPSRTLYGIQTQTSNETPHEIAAIWQRFMADGLADEIPERADDQLIAAYFDYQGDHTQPYTFFLGCEVIDVDCAPEGFALRSLPAGRYAAFQARGPMPKTLIESWQQIRQSDLPRSYVADFEVHDPAKPDEVAIYVGVR